MDGELQSGERDGDVPVPQSELETQAAPGSAEPGDDPMVSIRPQLPVSPAALDPTVELSELATPQPGSGIDLEDIDTAVLGRADRRGAQLETHDSGAFVIPVLEVGSSPRVGAYQLEERIGAGGMGEVWSARQPELGRRVALKRVRDARKRSASIKRHFKSEARLTALLDHPNIVTIHELGEDQGGRTFYTMKLIEGQPWSELLFQGWRPTASGVKRELELRDHLEILLEVCKAMSFAHDRGVIHRDIKPGNVVVGEYGEVYLVDWGLAVAVDERIRGYEEFWTLDQLPEGAVRCGTPAYMSPETARASRGEIGPQTDVYLLGGSLFQVLYGRPPHQGRSADQVISRAKRNAWEYPDEVSKRLKPWEILLRPLINRALATKVEDRYQNAEEFCEALRGAIRNYESARIATRAQEQLARFMLESQGDSADVVAIEGGYRTLSRMIAQLEAALDSWPRNLIARLTLGQAQHELARLALANGDLPLATISLDAYEELPPLPDPSVDLGSRRLTLHPVDGTLINAPRPSDSLVAAGTSNEWVSSTADLQAKSGSGRGAARSGEGEVAATVGALELVAGRRGQADLALGLARTADGQAPGAASGSSLSMSSRASVEIQQQSDDSMIDEEQALHGEALRLRAGVRERETQLRRRRLGLWGAVALAAALVITISAAVVFGRAAVEKERDRARAERDKLSEALLEQTASTVEARLDVMIEPVHAALETARRWAEAGALDSDDPRELNRYFMPLLVGAEAASSTLRADAEGREYMLLSRGEEGWRTRSTRPGAALELRDWTPSGTLVELWHETRDYDPHARPWYIGGAALRASTTAPASHGGLRPVHWTEAYRLFTTEELGVSVSAPATSPSGREFVIAFDLKLDDVSRITGALPEGIERGQVFVLDEQLRLLALPRETNALSDSRRRELLLTPLAQAEGAPISRAAMQSWEPGVEGVFRMELDTDVEDNYWVSFRQVGRPGHLQVWIGVVVPESHFL